MRRQEVSFPLAFRLFLSAHLHRTIRAVFSPVGVWRKRSPADGAAFDLIPAFGGLGAQGRVLRQDGHLEPAPFPELMDKKTFVIMERKGDKGNGKQTQKRDSAAPVRRGVQGRSHPDGDRTGSSEHRGCQGTWYLHRHPAQLAEGHRCAGRSARRRLTSLKFPCSSFPRCGLAPLRSQPVFRCYHKFYKKGICFCERECYNGRHDTKL